MEPLRDIKGRLEGRHSLSCVLRALSLIPEVECALEPLRCESAAAAAAAAAAYTPTMKTIEAAIAHYRADWLILLPEPQGVIFDNSNAQWFWRGGAAAVSRQAAVMVTDRMNHDIHDIFVWLHSLFDACPALTCAFEGEQYSALSSSFSKWCILFAEMTHTPPYDLTTYIEQTLVKRMGTKECLAKLPACLLVRLNRTYTKLGQNGEDTGIRMKILAPCEYPALLDVLPWCTPTQRGKIERTRARYGDTRRAHLYADDRRLLLLMLGQRRCASSPLFRLNNELARRIIHVKRHSDRTGLYNLCAIIGHEGRNPSKGEHHLCGKFNDCWMQFNGDNNAYNYGPRAPLADFVGVITGWGGQGYLFMYR